LKNLTASTTGWGGGAAILAAAWALASAGLFLSSAFVPILGALAPTPLYFAFALLGMKGGAAIAGLSSVAIFAAAGAGQAFVYLSFCGMMAGALALSRERLFPLEKTLAAMVIPAFLAGSALFMASADGKGALELGAGWGDSLMVAMIESHKSMNSDPAVTEWLSENRSRIGSALGSVFPSLALISLLLIAAVNIVVTRIISLKTGIVTAIESHELALWKTPDALVWGVVFPGFGVMFADGALCSVSANAFLVTLALFMIQGVAIIHHWFRKNSASVVLRAIGYFVIFSHPLFMLLTSGLGLMEVWVDLRKDRNP
jgi:hypothetical protein